MDTAIQNRIACRSAFHTCSYAQTPGSFSIASTQLVFTAVRKAGMISAMWMKYFLF